MFDSLLPRRELLRIGALSLFGALGSRSFAAERSNSRSCIFILLQGGASHHDLWDPKPDAPAEVRGPFGTLATALSGVRFGELLPRTAAIADKLVIVRSMTHQFTNHIAGTYITLTGSTNQPDADREARSEDFPGPGAVLNYLQTEPPRVPVSVSLPNWLSIPGPSNRMPGQYGGFLGSTFDPFLVQGDPNQTGFRPLSLTLPDEVPGGRFQTRTDLLRQIDAGAEYLENQATRTRDRLYSTAYDLLTDPRVREALDLNRESTAVRDRYGRSKIGQSLLLARRLVEAGVRFVAYNEFNQAWDHHGDIQGALKRLVPAMEQGHSALVEDLHERGMLDNTLVVNTGEFGRTPQINGGRGRDHWPFVYSTVLAGGGLRGGQVYGASDAKGAYVASKPVSPADLLATLWTSLGIEPRTEIHDRSNRPYALCTGQPLHDLM